MFKTVNSHIVKKCQTSGHSVPPRKSMTVLIRENAGTSKEKLEFSVEVKTEALVAGSLLLAAPSPFVSVRCPSSLGLLVSTPCNPKDPELAKRKKRQVR